jgi:hypothetical protein
MSKPFSWSYSQLKNFETCPKRYYHYNVLKDVVEPESDQIREGNALHKAFELRIKDKAPLPLGMGYHEPVLAKLEKLPGKIYAEQKLALTSSFAPCAYFARGVDVWFRTVVDFAAIDAPNAIILDYKTGKVQQDTTQLQLMSATVFAADPSINRIKAGLMFTAYGQIEREEYVRDDLTEIWGEILPRVKLVERARASQEYPPKPSGLCKKYCAVMSCPYHGR